MDIQTILNSDGGLEYTDEFIDITSKRVIHRNKYYEDGSGVYLVDKIEKVIASQDTPWSSTFFIVLIALAFIYFGWIWTGLGCAAAAFL